MPAWLEHDDQGCINQLRWEPYEWPIQDRKANPRVGVIVCAVCDSLFDYGVTEAESNIIMQRMRKVDAD